MKAHHFFLIPALCPFVAFTSCSTGPGQVEAIRGQTSFVRDGMTRKMTVAASVQGGDGMSTGSSGQTQVDTGLATVRAGSDTDLYLNKNRDGMTLKSGLVLVSNKTKGRGFDLETAQHRATSYGTMQVSYLKDKYLKVLCIEGKVEVALKALAGDSVSIQPGQMVVITPTEDRLPDPVSVDLNRIAATSVLMGPGFVVPSLSFPGGPRVTRAIAGQEQAIAQGAGDDTRETLTANSPIAFDLMGYESNDFDAAPGYDRAAVECFDRLTFSNRDFTIENVLDVLDEARRGVPVPMQSP